MPASAIYRRADSVTEWGRRDSDPSGATMARTDRGFLLQAALIAVDLALLPYLAGGWLPALAFLLFLALFLAPAVLLVTRLPFLRTLPEAILPHTAAALVAVACVPWFFLRKALGTPPLLDLLASGLLVGGAARVLRRSPLRMRFRPQALSLVVLTLPIVFALAWLGYEACSADVVRYYGLFTIDFGSLVSVVTTIRSSPSLPMSLISDGTLLNYHWLYFTVPALLADFLGFSLTNANALLLTNLCVAALLVATIGAVCRQTPATTSLGCALAAGLVVLCPLTSYFDQFLSPRLGLPLPERNYLLLSPLNSAIVFGNNTLALVLALLAFAHLAAWNESGRPGNILLTAVFLALLPGYSVTLLFPLLLALAVLVLSGGIHRPFVAAAIGLATAAVLGAAFLRLGILGGEASSSLALAFDRGQFLRVVLLGLIPLWGVAVLGMKGKPRRDVAVLIAACLLVPSWLYMQVLSGGIVFSMKVGSLMAVAFGPLVAAALSRLLAEPALRWRRAVAAALVCLGLVQSAVYVFQFPYLRLFAPTLRSTAIPSDYWRALTWLRTSSPPRSVVVDPFDLDFRSGLRTTMVAERRVWLPTAYVTLFPVQRRIRADVLARRDLWRRTVAGDASAAREIARQADYLVASSPLQSPSWRPVFASGSWVVYRGEGTR